MTRKLLTTLFILLAIGLAVATRFYLLGKAPAGLYLDEAGQGYSAYSILKTGKDEFGKVMPIVFRSFIDFKTPVYIYLVVPLIPVFGLTSFTVRFPSFIFSVITIPVLYLLIREFKIKKTDFYNWLVAIFSILLLSISPWHILFGRTNFECNVALLFLLCGCLFFFKSLTKPYLLIVSAIFFAIAIPSYHAQRIVTPLMGLVLYLRYKQTLLSKSHLKYLIVGATIAFIISIPTLSIANTPGFLARASGLNIFSHSRQNPAGYFDNYTGPLSFVVNGSWFLSAQEFASLYVSYFSPRNLFILGDSGPRSSFPELATLFIWQFPFLLLGIYKLVKAKDMSDFKYFVLAFLLISPIPASLTRDPYSTIRSLQMVIPLTILTAVGLTEVFNFLKSKTQRLLFVAGFGILIIYSVGKLYSSVIVLNEYYRGIHWNYGWEQASNIIKNKLDGSLPIIVDNSRDEPYIQLAFFLKYDPVAYQKENFEVPLNEYYTNLHRDKNKKIGNISTQPIDWEKDLLKEQYLIGDDLAISNQQVKEHNLQIIDEVKYPDGSVAIRIVKSPRIN